MQEKQQERKSGLDGKLWPFWWNSGCLWSMCSFQFTSKERHPSCFWQEQSFRTSPPSLLDFTMDTASSPSSSFTMATVVMQSFARSESEIASSTLSIEFETTSRKLSRSMRRQQWSEWRSKASWALEYRHTSSATRAAEAAVCVRLPAISRIESTSALAAFVNSIRCWCLCSASLARREVRLATEAISTTCCQRQLNS